MIELAAFIAALFGISGDSAIYNSKGCVICSQGMNGLKLFGKSSNTPILRHSHVPYEYTAVSECSLGQTLRG